MSVSIYRFQTTWGDAQICLRCARMTRASEPLCADGSAAGVFLPLAAIRIDHSNSQRRQTYHGKLVTLPRVFQRAVLIAISAVRKYRDRGVVSAPPPPPALQQVKLSRLSGRASLVRLGAEAVTSVVPTTKMPCSHQQDKPKRHVSWHHKNSQLSVLAM